MVRTIVLNISNKININTVHFVIHHLYYDLIKQTYYSRTRLAIQIDLSM